MSYYAYVSLQSSPPVAFAVPTGNFGNIFAGLAVREMGLPIDRFVLATNENDILARFFQTGVYRRGEVRYTLSPSMDIQVASNLERFIHLRCGGDAARVRTFLADFQRTGEADLPGLPDPSIASVAVDNAETEATIRSVHERHGYVVDPHTAVGIAAARRIADSARPICMAAAHPAKFPDAVRAATGTAVRHPCLDALDAATERRTVLPPREDAVRAYVEGACAAGATGSVAR